jgi:PAS domain S-box-containing protein
MTALEAERGRDDSDSAAVERLEAALAAAEARFRNVAAALPGLLFLTDRQGANTYVNERYARYTGLSQDALMGDGWLATIHPDDAASVLASWERAVAVGEPYSGEYRIRDDAGEYRWFLCHAVPHLDPAGAITQWAGTATDIHDRKLAEEAAALKQTLLQSVLEASPDPIFAKDLNGAFVLANPATSRVLGVSTDVVGKRDRDLVASAAALQIEENDARVLAGETIVVEEIIEELGLATETFLVTKAPLRDSDGRIVGLVGLAQDISDRKESERHRELLIAELNHRVKNTLAVVQAVAAQTFKPGADPAGARRDFESRLTTLAEAHDVLTSNSWDAIRLQELLERAIAPFRRDGRERFELHGPEVRVEARVAVGFALAIHELATNALKYGALSQDAGRVLIRWHVVRTPEGPRMKLVWREEGGPPVTPPKRRGFGSRMIEQGLASELGGSVALDFGSAGVTCRIEAPLPY